jgi:hypothetical protein
MNRIRAVAAAALGATLVCGTVIGVRAQQPASSAAPAASAQPAGTQQASEKPAPQKLTFPGDVALWTVAIKPDKTAAFEQIMTRVRDALNKSGDPASQRQAAGWKVMKIDKPLPDGNIAYVHVISPVVPDADYTVMQILYDAFPDERQMLYEMYRDSFAANLSLASGRVTVDLGGAAATASLVAR